MPETTLDLRDTSVIRIAKVIQDISLLPPEQNVGFQLLRDQRKLSIGGGWRGRVRSGCRGSRGLGAAVRVRESRSGGW